MERDNMGKDTLDTIVYGSAVVYGLNYSFWFGVISMLIALARFSFFLYDRHQLRKTQEG